MATTKQRTMRIISHGKGRAVVEVKEGKKTDLYFLEEIPAQFGRGFIIKKNGEKVETYQANFEDNVETCDCAAGVYRGQCRHISFIRVLTRDGKI